ncbi:hypothetical protein ABE10_02170, partial [Bacillus toyonensis]|nr:hypothetical protein [Bacillus toyonensis]
RPDHGVEHRQRRVEVVEAGVDEVQRDDLAPEDLSDLAVAVSGGAEAGPGQDHVAREQEVALALVDLLRLDRVEAVRTEPVGEGGGLAGPLLEAELGDVGPSADHEAAVGRVDHVGVARERIDQLDLVPELDV